MTVIDRATASRVVGRTGSSVGSPVVEFVSLKVGSGVAVNGGGVVVKLEGAGVSVPPVVVEVDVELGSGPVAVAVVVNEASVVVAASRVVVDDPSANDAETEVVQATEAVVEREVMAWVVARATLRVVAESPVASAASVVVASVRLGER